MKRPPCSSIQLSMLHLFLVACCLFSAIAFPPGSIITTSTAASQQNAPTPQLGKAVEKTLAGGETHNYNVTAQAGQFLRVIVEQRGIDIKLTVFAPDGKQLLEVDGPNGEQGPEAASVITTA